MIEVLKRDKKTKECFQEHKIHHAIENAYKSIGKTIDEDVFKCALERMGIFDVEEDEEVLLNVEDIQDSIERCLFDYDIDVAISFHDYRLTHKLIRSERKGLAREFAKKLMCENIENQNANVDEYSFGGRMGEASNVYKKDFALNNCVSKQTKRNHLNNESYIHDLDNYASGEHNCFERSTRFVTTDGIMSFDNFEDGESVTVLTKNGKWSTATVHKYGRGKINDIVLCRCGKEITIGATKNHRWILKNGEVVTDLHVGDELFPLVEISDDFSIETEEDAYWWCFGFIIGDGCDHYKRTQCRLCGSKITYVPIFEKAHYKLNGKDVYVKILKIGKQEFLTNKMWKMLTKKQMQMVFNGYMSADGENDGKNCSTSDKRILEMICDISCVSGRHVHSIKMKVRNTPYKENVILWNIRFTTSQSANNLWKVKEIVPRNHCNDTLWCVEEPSTHSFTLEGGVVTGNCLSLPLDELFANGAKVGQIDIRPAGSINSAMQLVAVYFQVQSLQQFGGVSATHLDWTMIPYVRKSFFKHFTDCYITEKAKEENVDFSLLSSDEVDEYKQKKRLEFREKYNIEDENFTMGSFSVKVVNFHIDDEKIKLINKEWYNKAFYETKNELNQSVESMYHNLNSLQSRSGRNDCHLAA